MPPVFDSTGSTYNRSDFTDTNAFFWSSLDLSSYAGTDLGSTPYYIRLVDGAGKIATGYIGAVGAGETLGGELCTDPGFDNAGLWTGQDNWSVVGGKGIATATGDGSFLYQSNILASGLNQLFKTIFTIDSINAGIRAFISNIFFTIQTTTGTKTEYKVGVGGVNAGFQAADTLTVQIDTVSFKQVIDPPSTAIHIVSSLNGTTRNWESIESGFNPNTIASWGIYDSSVLLSPSMSPSVSPSLSPSGSPSASPSLSPSFQSEAMSIIIFDRRRGRR